MSSNHLPSSELDFGPFQPPATNLVDRLAYWAAQKGNETAFSFLPDGEIQSNDLTYSQLHHQARALARRLEELGMRGERALLLYPPGLDFIVALFGCFYAGVVAVPAYPPRRNRNMLRIEAISDDCEAAIALTVDEVAARAESFFDEAPGLRRLNWLATDTVSAAPQADWKTPALDNTSLALLQYTSGSTGMPKGVMLSHGNLMHNVAVITQSFQPYRDAPGVTWLPMYHDMGLVGGVLNPLFVGRANVVIPPMAFLSRPVRWLKAISQYRAIISGGPNFAYQLCAQRIDDAECQGLDLSCWEVAFNGAEPIRADTLARFSEKFAPYGFRPSAHYACYGLAETTLMVAGGHRQSEPITSGFDGKALDDRRVVPRSNGSTRSRRLVGCGAAVSGMHLVVADPDNGRPLPDDHVGEILISGPSVAHGYWRKPEITRQTFQVQVDGDERNYLRTGDLGFLHSGELFITGRLKDLIIVRGMNRYPEDLEQTIERCDARLHGGTAAAFAVELHQREQLVVVCEVYRGGEKQWHDAIGAIRRSVLKEHDVAPDAVTLVRFGSIPKTSSGKIQRHACREAFLDGTLKVVAQWRSWKEGQQVQDWSTWQDAYDNSLAEQGIDPRTAHSVLEVVRAVAGQRATEFTLETNIIDAGLDSLERMDIVARLEKTFGGRFPGDIMTELETCREVVLAVQAYLGSREQAAPDEGDDTAEKIPREDYDFRHLPEYRRLRDEMSRLEKLGLANPYFESHQSITGDTTIIDGRVLVNFASYNYLGMSGDPVVAAAAKAAIDQYGTSVSASRLVSGQKPLHQELEQEIARFLGVEDAVTFVGGHATNETTIGHLFGPGDLILHDGLAHNSIVQGALLSGARRRPFPHNDWQALDRVLGEMRSEHRRVLVAIEGAYSMDGDYPDLPRFVEVKRRHRAFLLVDEAHSLGTMGRTGRGIAEHFSVEPGEVDLWMGTLSKSLGSCGGYIAGCRELVEYLRYTAPGFVYSVGLSPANAAAALASLRQLQAHPDRVTTLQRRARLFLNLAKQYNLHTGASNQTPIIPLVTGDSVLAVNLARLLKDHSINVQPIIPPAVPEKSARLRFFITALHSEGQIEHAIETAAACLRQLQSMPELTANPTWAMDTMRVQ